MTLTATLTSSDTVYPALQLTVLLISYFTSMLSASARTHPREWVRMTLDKECFRTRRSGRWRGSGGGSGGGNAPSALS